MTDKKYSGNGKDPGNTLWGKKDDAYGTGIGILYDEITLLWKNLN